MGKFDYAGRALAARQARAEADAAFKEVADRRNDRDPKTRRWHAALERFWSACHFAYPPEFHSISDVNVLHSADMVEFLEADPMFFRSGYMKEEILDCLKQRYLEPGHVRRLQDVVIAVARKRDCREFRRYCRLAAHIDGERLRAGLRAVADSGDANARRRAGWVLAALEQARV